MASKRSVDLLTVPVLLWLTAGSATAETPTTLHAGCQDKCGNVNIPYPFGIGSDCSFNPDFNIRCDTNSSPPKPRFYYSPMEILEISPDGYFRTVTGVAKYCNNQTRGGGQPNVASANLTKFPFSHTQNKIVGIGCDTLAVIYGGNNQEYATGCVSACNSLDSVKNGSCDGVGCCQIDIPQNLAYYNVSVSSFRPQQNDATAWELSPCIYAFVVQQSAFHFSTANFTNINDRISSVRDWAIGNTSCEEAQRMDSTSYACKANSHCYDPDNGPGYRCNCSKGYRGNPYLQNGCKDIDECSEAGLNNCTKDSYCHDTLGSYTCSCPKGYHGDGRKDGEGCIAHTDNQLVKIMVGVGVGLVALTACSGWLYYVIQKRKLIKLKEKYFKENGGIMLQQRLAGRGGSNDATAKIYTTEELKKATDDFNENNIIGKGGYGVVYKGTLPGNRIVAIKKSKIVDKDQIEQFINEVVVLSQINHRNVVKLLGCCLETEVPLLVYEFITNGTVFSYIHDERKASAFSWDLRLRIAIETAGVLGYLHSEASIPIIHRDVKSNNVLLDDNFTAKVSDFGASRLAPADGEGISTVVQGTLGYLDPEYLLTSQLTEKSDVYSYGVLLVELMTGKDVFSNERPERERGLAIYFLSALNEGRLLQVIDQNCVAKEGNKEQVSEIAKLVKRCLSVKGEERPTMKEVAMELEGLRIMGKEKHQWVDSEETESLIQPNQRIETHIHVGHGEDSGTISSGAGYDSAKNQVVLPISGGR